VKDLDNFINHKKLLQDLPADTMIKTAGDKYGMTAGEMREQLGIKEPKYQRAYHG
jgi:2-keto-4-pentenoate hydratase